VTSLPVGFPTGPLFDATTGEVTPAWRQFFVALWQRTGSAAGIVTTDTASLEASLAAETIARQTADAGLTNAIAQERARAEGAEGGLISDMQVVSYSLQSQITSFGSYANANYVLISNLASLWAAQNYNFLPAIDPGSGKPWLDGNTLSVGAGRIPIELESGAGRWLTEAGTGAWEFG
jgi:hypothetical protein